VAVADAVPLQAPVQRRAGQERDCGLQRVEAVQRMASEGDDRASSWAVSTVEWTTFEPMGASCAKARLRHLATVFWLSPYCAASSLSVAADRCIAARMAYVVVVLP